MGCSNRDSVLSCANKRRRPSASAETRAPTSSSSSSSPSPSPSSFALPRRPIGRMTSSILPTSSSSPSYSSSSSPPLHNLSATRSGGGNEFLPPKNKRTLPPSFLLIPSLLLLVLLVLPSPCSSQFSSAQYRSPKFYPFGQPSKTNAIQPPQGATSLAFVFDITGSMYDDLVQVIEGAAKILKTTLSRREKPLYNYVLVPFHDPEIGPITVTTDPDKFQRELRDLYVQGGGDCPEMSVGAVKRALEVSLPSSFIYVFTDARSKDYDLTEDVLELIQKKQSQVVFVMTGDCGNTTHAGYKAFEQIASTSSGQIFHLTKSDVDEVLNFVRVSIQSRKVNLLSIDKKKGEKIVISLPVDSQLRQFTVSVSGKDPKIIIKDPEGRVVRKRNGLQQLLRLPEVLILSINSTARQPGQYKLTISSAGPFTVRVTGLSSLDFSHGFSRVAKSNMIDIALRPIKGVQTHVIINATELDPGERGAIIQKMELLDLAGDSLVELPAKRIPASPSLYNMTAFQPPDQFFYIKVSGMDIKGFPFQRTTSTAISPETPAAPVVAVDKKTKGYYGQETTLVCQVESIVPFTVQWFRDGKQLGNKLFYSNTRNVTYTIPDSSSFAEGAYDCNATNLAGSGTGRTYLDVQDPPPDIMPPFNVSVVPGQKAVLTCVAFSTVEFNLTWSRERGGGGGGGAAGKAWKLEKRITEFTNGSLEIKRAKKSDEGFYVCTAMNEGGATTERVYLTVQVAPRVRVVPKTQNFIGGSTVNLTCLGEGVPAPIYTWRRSGGLILPGDKYAMINGTLVIFNVRKADGGEYACVGTNPAGRDTAAATIKYIEKPNILVPESRVIVSKGAAATLRCIAEGIPKPQIKWFKGGIEIISSPEVLDTSYFKIGNEGELIIIGVQDMDGGDYKCIATNEAGTEEAKIKLKVGSIPEIVQAPSKVGFDIQSNGTLPCVAIGIPPPKVFWRRKDGRPLDLSPGSRFKQMETGSLFIRGITIQDEGIYVCSVQNRFGTTEAEADVDITGIQSPIIAYARPKVEVIKGNPVTIKCVVLLGNPTPKITWLKNGIPLREKDHDHIKITKSGYLEMKKTFLEDEAIYACVASNVGGNATHETKLDVQVAPYMEGAFEESIFKVISGNKIRLPCRVRGDPTPAVTWTKNGQTILPTDPHYYLTKYGHLEIANTDLSDSGTYVCSAINVAGTAVREMTLIVQIPPTINSREMQHEVNFGESIEITCEVTSEPPAQIQWKRDGEQITRGSAGYRILSNGALQLLNAKVSDSGTYICTATNVAGNSSKKFSLSVRVPPSILGKPPTGLQIILGKPAVLDCITKGDPLPLVRWEKDGIPISIYKSEKYKILDTGSLSISSVSLNDKGEYVCIAENPAGKDSRLIDLDVLKPPEISIETPKELIVIEHEKVNIPCFAIGLPAPTISWFKDGRKVTGNEVGVTIQFDGSLQLLHAQPQDAGRYKCVASNVAGNVSHDIDFQVHIPPKVNETNVDVEVIVYKTTSLKCQVVAIPPPQIMWLKNGEPVDFAVNPHVEVSPDASVLTITQASKKDNAVYTCIISNQAGDTEKNFDLDVLEPPSFADGSLSNNTVIEKRDITLDCPARGNPFPKITWYQNGTPITTNNRIRILADGRQLQIKNTAIGDASKYTCRAENKAGEVQKNFILSVHVPPAIQEGIDLTIPETVEVIVNTTAAFDCYFEAIPPPRITWIHSGELLTGDEQRIKIVKTGQKMKILKAKVTDAGRYTCIVSNVAGQIEKNFDLTVLVPPTIEVFGLSTTPQVVVKHNVTIDCPASGNPPPTLRWLKDGQPITSSHATVINGGRQLIIARALVTDTAQYRCIATNVAGESAVNFNLEVLVPPNIAGADILERPEVIVNRTIRLDCPASGVPAPSVSWYKDGRPLETMINPENKHFQLLLDGRQLQINNAHVTDASRYTCIASNVAGQTKKNFKLSVQVPPFFEQPNTTPNLQVVVNRTVVISCPASGTPMPSIRWEKDGNDLVQGLRYQFIMGGKQLSIRLAQITDTGRYNCVARNVAGESRRDFLLDVLLPPYIDNSNIIENPRVVINSTVSINCPATGIPPPLITWLKDGQPLTVFANENVELLFEGQQLKISTAMIRDTARYTCVATNIAGEADYNFDLDVLVPPSIDMINVNMNPSVIEGRTVIIDCPASGLPEPQISWLKDGQALDLFNRANRRRIDILSNGRQIQIKKAVLKDRARYTCVASNEAGIAEKNFDLDVLVPPMIDSKEVGVLEPRVVVNNSITIRCPATGIPPPKIVWLKNGHSFVKGEDKNIKISPDGSELTISKSQVRNTAIYTCKATNKAGETQLGFDLRVMVPPRIGIQLGNVDTNPKVIKGRTITIKCPAKAVPAPKITWLKDGEDISILNVNRYEVFNNDLYLRVVSAEIEDTARFTCRATNDAGSSELDFDLEVQVPPSIENSQIVENIKVIENRSVTVDCRASGIPQPMVSWLKNSQPMDQLSEVGRIRKVASGRGLEIKTSRVSDTGRYSCVATNVAGELEKHYSLEVLVPPHMDESNIVETLRVIVNRTIVIECPAFGIPAPSITWLKDGRRIESIALPRSTIVEEGRGLRIRDSQVIDEGQYTCIANNIAGELTRNFNLDVFVPPTIQGSDMLNDMSVILNQGINIECPAAGRPPPEITWLKDGEPIRFPNSAFRLLNNGRRLQIISAQLVDIGGYTCIADNPAGETKKEFLLSVLVPPTIEDGPTSVVAIAGTRVMLECEVLGLPEPEVKWMKDGGEVPNVHGTSYNVLRSGSFEFLDVKVIDSGIYRCEAENAAGAVSREIALDVQVPPVIESESPQELKVVVNRPIVLPCRSSGVPTPRITWQKGMNVISSGGGYEISKEGDLRITRSQVRDSGVYICVAQNAAGTALGQVKLQVQVPPTIEEQNNDFTVIQDREVTLPCRTAGIPRPKITWEKDGAEISNNDFRYRLLPTGGLQIPISRPLNSGIYLCKGTNEAGQATKGMNLVVHVPPNIPDSNIPNAFTVTEGSSISLPCPAEGYPAPDISWQRDGRTISNTPGRFKVLRAGTLVFESTEASDSGTYVCTAINKAGRTSREMALQVQVAPSFLIIPNDLEITANGEIKLECQAEGIPTPEISWRLNNTRIPAPSISGRSVLDIANARKEDDGTYVCIAENPAGTRRAIAAVVVKVPPVVILPPATQAVTMGGKTMIECSVSGDPPPTILWTKNGRPVNTGNGRVRQMENGSLVMYDIEMQDAGQYKCVATNDAGAAEGAAMLIVRSAPEFEIEPRSTKVDQGSTIIMDCKAKGEPEPVITWRKNGARGGHKLESEDRVTILPNNSLRIVASQLSDSGEYHCIARNPLGSVLQQADITVQVHGMWSEWKDWSRCSTTCGIGIQLRKRLCNNPPPANGGESCKGTGEETRNCQIRDCPQDGQYSDWLPWEECSVSCGQGFRKRVRRCDNPRPESGGKSCVGEPIQREVCNSADCPVDGKWGNWFPWQPCSMSCGSGYQERYRRCDSPKQQYGGSDCRGSDVEKRACKVGNCPVDGNWAEWELWSICSMSCGGGTKKRIRKCENPKPEDGGRFCAGGDAQVDYCNNDPCPIHGNWSPWGDWGSCSSTCGGGKRHRYRSCSSPPPQNGGQSCPGQASEKGSCSMQMCPVDGNWADWSPWSQCKNVEGQDVMCGGGGHERFRTCSDPPPKFGGRTCAGDAMQKKKCHTQPCHKSPFKAFGQVIGNINDEEFGVSTLMVNVTVLDVDTMLSAKLVNVPPNIGHYLKNLVSILTPIYWSTAYEIGQAMNGYSLTDGKFRREVQVEFATGETLKMTHIARGLDAQGLLQLDMVLNGYVPKFPEGADIKVDPYSEEYIQTGPGTLYAYSSRMFHVNGYLLPYAWNHSISYDPALGKMPYLVERLFAKEIHSHYDSAKEEMTYTVSTSIAKGEPSNQCPAGFFLDQSGPYCQDDNECDRLSPCSHYCHNSPGSYYCSCPVGMMLDSDGVTCKDIDECEMRIARCHRNQDCINTLGSYKCVVRCGSGFRLSKNGRRCEDINECKERDNVCDHKCLNLIGSYRCACRLGYKLVGRSKCVDIDECNQPHEPCSNTCTNTPGSYECSCPSGYMLMGGGVCRDIDECAHDQHNCLPGQDCTNTQGGFMCVDSCPSGLERANNGTCIDINECAEGTARCAFNQICKNTFGSYTCACRRGYKSMGPGQPCRDINECLQSPSPCSYRCRNLRGDFECICPQGQKRLADRKSCAGLQYLGDGTPTAGIPPRVSALHRNITCQSGLIYKDGHCEDINECEIPDQCQYKCKNTLGSYQCSCPPGYRLDKNKRSCIDVDECLEQKIDCGPNSICFNRRGDYKCINTPCPPGYTRDETSGFCKLECNKGKNKAACPSGARYADYVEFKVVALPKGILADTDLIRLIAYDHFGRQLVHTNFYIADDDTAQPFDIRIEKGKGIVSSTQLLEEKEDFELKVRAISYDEDNKEALYQTSFIIFISVSAYTY